MKLVIIGGGASGMAAAIEAARHNPSIEITILEKMDRLGKKLLATGNGRCNFSNVGACTDNYYGKNKHFVNYCLNEFTVDNTVNFFNSMGIFPKEEERGKLYPFSAQASGVLDCLRLEIEHLGIKVINNFYVASVTKTKNKFKIESKITKTSKTEAIFADKLIIAGGGCASPNLGSDGSCFNIFKALGHTQTDIKPALVQLKTEPKEVKALQGIKVNACLKLLHNDMYIAEDEGELLFTDYGLSGPPIFNLSAKIPFKQNVTAVIDFMPEYNPKDVFDILDFRRSCLSHTTMENFFTGILNKRIGNLIARRCNIEKLSFKVSALTNAQLWAMAAEIKEYQLSVLGTKGFSNAQVTAGGINTNEFNNKTMESLIIKGVYGCGEVLDIYGDCGGYNLQWAWSSGRLAGISATKALEEKQK